MRDSDGPQTLTATQRCFQWWADRWWLQLSVLLTLTSAAVVGHFSPDRGRRWVATVWPETPTGDASEVPDNTAATSGPAEEPVSEQRWQELRRVERFQVSPGDCIVLVVIEDESRGAGGRPVDWFDGSYLKAAHHIQRRLESLPQVARVTWLDDIPAFNLFGLSGTLIPGEKASPRQLDFARQQTLNNPLAVGQLISPDARTVLFHIAIDWSGVADDADVSDALSEAARQAVAAAGGTDIRVMTTGWLPLEVMMANQHLTNSFRYQMIGYSIMIITALVLFRGIAAVIIVALAPAMGVFWTMGVLAMTDMKDNPFNDIIVPVLISLVGLADAVHLMVEIRRQRAEGFPARKACRRGLARVGMACLLTSVTTAIGFVSLMTADHDVVREFGWCCSLGVLLTFISVSTVIPLLCRSPIGRRLHVGLGRSLVDGQLRRIGSVVQWVLRHDRAMSATAIIATLVLAGICIALRPDEKRYSGLSESGEAALGLRHLDRSLGGLEFANVSLQWDAGTSQDDVLATLLDIDRILQREPLLGHPLGLTQMLAALPGDGNIQEKMDLMELLPASLKRAYYSPEGRYASISFRVQDRGIATYDQTFHRVRRTIQELQAAKPRFEISLFGPAIWRWENIYQIVWDLATSLGTAVVVIWIILTLFYRSLRIGLISVVPNLFPLVATGAMLVVVGQHLEMVTVCMFTICIGIAVDDTIHFLTRYQEEMRRGDDHREVIAKAFTGVGSALLMTTIVLVTGLGSAILGDSRDARLFGTMGCLTLSTALFADIVFLPALLSRFDSRREYR